VSSTSDSCSGGHDTTPRSMTKTLKDLEANRRSAAPPCIKRIEVHPVAGHEGPEGGGQRYSSTLSLFSALDGVAG
jgi:hypothetical protein